MSDYIHSRLKNRIVEIVDTLISNGSIKNPDLSHFANISHITLSRDNAYATLYVTCLEEKRLDKSVAALNNAAGFIQGRLAKLLNTRNTPRLTFVKDEDLKTANRIDEILEAIKASSSTKDECAESASSEKEELAE